MSLYENIHKKRKRIKGGSGEKMRKPGSKGAPTAKNFKQAEKTAKKKPSKTTKKAWVIVFKNWSWHWYLGFNIGFEIYEGEIKSDGLTYPVEYLLINIGPLRIQKGEYI